MRTREIGSRWQREPRPTDVNDETLRVCTLSAFWLRFGIEYWIECVAYTPRGDGTHATHPTHADIHQLNILKTDIWTESHMTMVDQ